MENAIKKINQIGNKSKGYPPSFNNSTYFRNIFSIWWTTIIAENWVFMFFHADLGRREEISYSSSLPRISI